MPKYINAEVLQSRLEDFSRWCKDGRKEGVDFVLDCPLPDIPTADVQEVRHGRWIDPECEFNLPKCSICGSRSHDATYADKDKFCSRCGAKMDGKDN